MANTANLDAARAIAAKINKAHPGTVLLGSEITYDHIPRVTSGSLALDVSLGGGWPLNKWNEIIGFESAGKTALILKTIAANQALDPNYLTVWIAAEDFVPEYAAKLGCDVDRIIVINTNIMEDAYDGAIEFLASKSVDCVVIDSLPALVPKQEDDKDMGEMSPGRGALLTGQFFRKQTPSIRRSLVEEERNVLAFMVNQYREKIGVMYGDNKTTPGGVGKNFAYFTRCEVRRDDWIEEGPSGNKTRVGQTLKVRTIKNKTHVPQQVATFDFYFADSGEFKAGDYDRLKEIIGLALDTGVIQRAGAFYSLPSNPEAGKWQGRDKVVEALREDSNLARDVSDEVLRIVTKKPIEKVRKVVRKA